MAPDLGPAGIKTACLANSAFSPGEGEVLPHHGVCRTSVNIHAHIRKSAMLRRTQLSIVKRPRHPVSSRVPRLMKDQVDSPRMSPKCQIEDKSDQLFTALGRGYGLAKSSPTSRSGSTAMHHCPKKLQPDQSYNGFWPSSSASSLGYIIAAQHITSSLLRATNSCWFGVPPRP